MCVRAPVLVCVLFLERMVKQWRAGEGRGAARGLLVPGHRVKEITFDTHEAAADTSVALPSKRS